MVRGTRAVIFDLDGVLVDTARLHFGAWRRLAEDLGIQLPDAIDEELRGVDRAASLEIVLGGSSQRFDARQKTLLSERKNSYYREALRALSERDICRGADAVLNACRGLGLKIAVASSSRNAKAIMSATGLANRFDVSVDGDAGLRSKPDPDIFLRAAELLDVRPEDCIGLEDAVAGVRALKAASMYAVGLGKVSVLAVARPDAILPCIGALRIEAFVDL